MNYRQALKQHRVSRGLSIYKLSRLTGISKNTLSSWENSKSIPRLPTLFKLADFYGITLDELVGRDKTFN